MDNWLLDADPQLRAAASRRMSRSAQRQRYAAQPPIQMIGSSDVAW